MSSFVVVRPNDVFWGEEWVWTWNINCILSVLFALDTSLHWKLIGSPLKKEQTFSHCYPKWFLGVQLVGITMFAHCFFQWVHQRKPWAISEFKQIQQLQSIFRKKRDMHEHATRGSGFLKTRLIRLQGGFSLQQHKPKLMAHVSIISIQTKGLQWCDCQTFRSAGTCGGQGCDLFTCKQWIWEYMSLKSTELVVSANQLNMCWHLNLMMGPTRYLPFNVTSRKYSFTGYSTCLFLSVWTHLAIHSTGMSHRSRFIDTESNVCNWLEGKVCSAIGKKQSKSGQFDALNKSNA